MEMKGKISGDAGVSLLGGDYEVVRTKKRGTLFIEARIRDGLVRNLRSFVVGL